MTWNWKSAVITAVIALPLAALGGIVADQGQGGTFIQDWKVSIAATVAGKTTEIAVTNSAGGTAVPTTALANRKAIEIQNLGPNPIYCTIDGTAPVVAKARRIDALGSTAQPAWSIDAGPNIAIKCIAATAAQSTGAATIVSEVR